jgi:ATP-dependent DNA ligase
MLSFPQDPMLARPVERLPEPASMPGGCVYEPKFDGYRVLLFVTDDGCRVQSRNGHDLTDAFQDIATHAEEEIPAGVVLDGELVVWGGDALDFTALQRRLATRKPGANTASMVAFDVLYASGTDLRTKPLRARRKILDLLLAGVEPPIQITPQTTDAALASEWLDDYASTSVGIEGLVIKGLNTTYDGGRRGWSKLRIRDTVEVVVGAVSGSLSAPERLVVGLPEPGGSFSPAGSTLPLTKRQQDTLAAFILPADDTHPWPTDMTSTARWGGTKDALTLVSPMVVEVSADTSFENGRWRHPLRLVRARPDLCVDEIT